MAARSATPTKADEANWRRNREQTYRSHGAIGFAVVTTSKAGEWYTPEYIHDGTIEEQWRAALAIADEHIRETPDRERTDIFTYGRDWEIHSGYDALWTDHPLQSVTEVNGVTGEVTVLPQASVDAINDRMRWCKANPPKNAVPFWRPSRAADLRATLVLQANIDHSQYPQYEGYWDGPQWRVARVRRPVTTKMGLAFDKGDIVLAKQSSGSLDQRLWVTGYSWRNRVNTSVWSGDIEFLT